MAETRTLRDAYIFNELAGVVGYDNVSQDQLVRNAYAGDVWALQRSFVHKEWPLHLPDYVVWPETVEQVSQVMRLANSHKLAVTPYCGGAGVAGGTIPLHGGISLDVKKLTKFTIDERNLTVTAQTGLIGQEMESQLNAKGYTWGHVPQSSYCSGLGGFIAAGSAGMLSTKYGKVSDMIQGMEVVLPSGKIIRIKSVPRSAAGPNLNYLFMGSEGTFGVITEATLAIHPMPEERRFHGFLMPDLHTGIEAARKILRTGLRPAAMRLSDKLETQLFYKLDGCQLLFCFDGFKELVDLEESTALRIVEAEGGVDLGTEPGDRWWNHRYTLAYPRDGGAFGLGGGIVGTTVGNVWDSAGSFDYLEAVHEEMGRAVSRIRGTIFAAHFSHWYKTGGMMYPYAYVNADTPEEMTDLYFRLQKRAVDAILKCGGTINHHHGVGLSLSPFMRDEFGASFEVLQKVKHVLDPNNIMNPGKLGFEE